MKFLLLLVTLCSFAEDTKYTLKKYGDTISKRLIKEGYIESKNEIQKIKDVLDYNTLDWIKARSLPIGFDFYIQGKEEKITHITESEPIDLRVGVGVFYHTQDDGNSEIFSDLSQYFDGEIEYKSYYLGFKLDHLVYSIDQDQNIVSDKDFLNYSISLGKSFNFFHLGVYSNSFIIYKTDSLNQVDISKEASSGLEFGLSNKLISFDKVHVHGLAKLKYSLIGTGFLDLYLGLQNRFKWFDKNLSFDLDYSNSKVDDDYFDQRASTGISFYF